MTLAPSTTHLSSTIATRAATTPCRAQVKTLHLVDIENLVAGRATGPNLRIADHTYRRVIGVHDGDQVRIACATPAAATLAFAVHHGGPAVAEALRALAADVAARLAEPGRPDTSLPIPAALLAAHGRLDPAALAAARSDAWHDIVVPTLELVLAAGDPRRLT